MTAPDAPHAGAGPADPDPGQDAAAPDSGQPAAREHASALEPSQGPTRSASAQVPASERGVPGTAADVEPSSHVLWQGELVPRGRVWRRAFALVGGGLCWLLAFLVLPSLILAAVAFATRTADGQIEWTWTLDSFRRLAGYGILGWSPDYLRIFWRSLWVAGLTTVGALSLAYPLAFLIARSRRWRTVLLALVAVPMGVNLVVRTYAWEVLLSPQLPPARLASLLGLIEPGEGLYPGTFAALLGMVAHALPFAVLPLYTNVERLDPALSEAARDLYASPWRVFRQAVLPQTLPGLRVAAILTFVPAVGMFVITDRLGGGNFMLVGNLIQQQFGSSRDYPFGAAVSLVLIALTLGALLLYRGRAAAPDGQVRA